MVTEVEVQEYGTALRGTLFAQGDDGYDEARTLFNAMIDKSPALIAQCRDVADVISSVKFGRSHNLEVAIRGGGHNGPGLGSVDGGLVIDLSQMNGVRVDPGTSTVRVQGGCTWGDVDHATHTFGLAVPTGIISTTGVGGLTLGGGLGYLTREYGLTIDNLLAADVVLADGRFVTASPEENSDLFWALRGGGGNFGVVTSFLFQCRPVGTVYGGPIFWPLEYADKVMRMWKDIVLSDQQDLSGFFAFAVVPPGPPFPEEHHMKNMCAVVWCYTGDLAGAEQVFEPIRAVAPAAIDFCGPIPMPALNGMFDALYSPGLQWYWKADFFNDLNDEAIALNIQHGSQLPSVHSATHIYPVNGKAHQVGQNDTPWSYREANFSQVIIGVSPDPADNERTIKWSNDYWNDLHPHSSGGAYVNMIMEEGQERVQAAYRDNYPRLAQIKAKYDPENFFHVNQNIKPG